MKLLNPVDYKNTKGGPDLKGFLNNCCDDLKN